MSNFKNQRCWLTVDRSALKHNLAQIKKNVPNASVMAVIKANGYGHGMEEVATVLDGADEFAVSDFNDLYRLHAAGVTKPINLLSPIFNYEDVKKLATLNARAVIYEWAQLQLLEQLDASAQLNVWLKVDTGMGRLGFLYDEYKIVLARLLNNPAIASVLSLIHI